MMDAPPSIALIGASGTLGSLIATALERRGEAARLISRSPERLDAGLHSRVKADLDQPETLPPALAGIETLILITAESPRQDRQGIAAIHAAQQCGVTRVVLLSAMLAGTTSRRERHFGGQHARIEQALAKGGMDHAILRPGFFMQSFFMLLRDLRRGRLIAPVPHGRVAFVDARDVAEAAAIAALSGSSQTAPFVLTGAEAYSFAQVAAALSLVAPRPIRHIAPPLWLARLILAMTQGRYAAANLEYLFTSLEAGREAEPTSDLARLLGRPPTSLSAFAERDMRPALALRSSSS